MTIKTWTETKTLRAVKESKTETDTAGWQKRAKRSEPWPNLQSSRGRHNWAKSGKVVDNVNNDDAGSRKERKRKQEVEAYKVRI